MYKSLTILAIAVVFLLLLSSESCQAAPVGGLGNIFRFGGNSSPTWGISGAGPSGHGLVQDSVIRRLPKLPGETVPPENRHAVYGGIPSTDVRGKPRRPENRHAIHGGIPATNIRKSDFGTASRDSTERRKGTPMVSKEIDHVYNEPDAPVNARAGQSSPDRDVWRENSLYMGGKSSPGRDIWRENSLYMGGKSSPGRDSWRENSLYTAGKSSPGRDIWRENSLYMGGKSSPGRDVRKTQANPTFPIDVSSRSDAERAPGGLLSAGRAPFRSKD
ncbi:hypothetical protein CDD83_4835 [Cordyceps sp. RAO-2017]|nr:hypothetical protein CDD83_4835 [Cordyceps sp. RAO-2017]